MLEWLEDDACKSLTSIDFFYGWMAEWMDVKGIYCIIHVGFEQLPDPISEMDPWKKSQVMKQSFLLKQRQT